MLLYMSSRLSKVRSVHTYVCYALDGLFWLNLYNGKLGFPTLLGFGMASEYFFVPLGFLSFSDLLQPPQYKTFYYRSIIIW